jgi:hypothetical protein
MMNNQDNNPDTGGHGSGSRVFTLTPFFPMITYVQRVNILLKQTVQWLNAVMGGSEMPFSYGCW